MESDQLVQRKNPLYGYFADPCQRLHYFTSERAGKQGWDRLLPESSGRCAGLGNRVEHALPYVLRVLQSDYLGVDRSDVEMEQFPASVSRDSVDRSRLDRLLHIVSSLLQRKNRLPERIARAPDLSSVPARQSLAIRSSDSTSRSARDCRSHCVHAGFEAFRRHGHLRRDVRVFAGHFFRGRHAGANALRRNSLLGVVIPRKTRPDDRLWTRDAQFLPLLQCRGWLAIFAASDSRDLRIAAGTSSAATSKQSCLRPGPTREHAAAA